MECDRASIFSTAGVGEREGLSDERPEVTGTRHVLPFGELSPGAFERLGLALLAAEGYEDVRHLGAAGQDGGIDLVAVRGGQMVAVQCKRHEQFGPKDAEAAVRELLSRPLSPPVVSLLLLVSCTVSRTAEERAAEMAGGLPVKFWALTELDQKVHCHPEILDQFFDLCSGRERPGPLVAPAPPARFTGRVEILDAVRRKLVAGEDVGLTALQGMGGIGKTALALKLAEVLTHEERDAFPGGVLWWELGPEPDVLGALDAWARAADSKSDLSSLPDAASRAAAVRQLLGPHGRLCAVLDDVWDAESARALLAAVPAGCPRLVTTRDGHVARQLRCEVLEVEALPSEEALDLLGKLVPGGIAGHEAAAGRIAELTERLPLALEIAAGLVDRASELPDLAGRLASRPRIEVLSLAGHRQDSVEVCFTLSYR